MMIMQSLFCHLQAMLQALLTERPDHLGLNFDTQEKTVKDE